MKRRMNALIPEELGAGSASSVSGAGGGWVILCSNHAPTSLLLLSRLGGQGGRVGGCAFSSG